MYYIYHIKGVKIGVSQNPERRVRRQGYSEFEILEEHTDIMKVSERERELQKEYGYRVDSVPFHITMERNENARQSNLGKPKGKAHMNKMQRAAKESKLRVENMSKFNKTKRRLTYTDAQQIRSEYALGAFTYAQLGKMYGVHAVSIMNIIHNKTYVTP